MSSGSFRINREAVITPTVDLPQYAHLRDRYVDRVVREVAPPTAAQLAAQDRQINHHDAQESAARRGPVVYHSAEEVNARNITAAQRPQRGDDEKATIAFIAEVERLHGLLDQQHDVIAAQGQAIAQLQKRLADLDGNAFVGETT